MTNTIWKSVVGYEGLYEVSNFGDVKVLDREVRGKLDSIRKVKGRMLKKHNDTSGYPTVTLTGEDGKRKTIAVHRLVASTFLESIEGKQVVNHKDGNKTNNHVENLEWVTHSENTLHAIENGLKEVSDGENSPRAKFTQEEIDWIRENYIPRHKEFGQRALARRFGVVQGTIHKIINNGAYIV
ncbi:NUMOD4 motif-containing HNH endonuclease [Bacillus paranthracis]|uniref:NUMOD4 motif-containing HNH endonuclease n=1 Tax=Bacillus paranthracis TaxID=2026186 RepID=UPI003D65C801